MAPAVAQGVDRQPSIAVAGRGEVAIKPDTVVAAMGVTVRAATVAEARRQSNSAMEKLLGSLKGNGVKDEDIQTVELTIYPEYRYRRSEDGDRERRLVGYRATNIVSVRLRELGKAAAIIDDAVTAGGDLSVLNGIRFTVYDNVAALKTARDRAMADARDKATQLARLGGVSLGDPIEIVEGILPYAYDGASLRVAATATEAPIQPGQLTISVAVTVTYAIR